MQDQLKEILKQQLRDVHSPDPIGWWPLAVGWWILIGLLIAVLVGATWWLVKRARRERYRKTAVSELVKHFRNWQQSQHTDRYLQNTSAVLRRIILHINDDPNLTTVSGNAWVNILEQHSGVPFTTATKTALAESIYRTNIATDVPAVHAELLNWVAKHKERKLAPSKLQATDQVSGATND
jgi:hypothetical protein